MDEKRFNALLTEYLALEAESAKEAGAIGYMARALVQATLPHQDPGKEMVTWGRKNGAYTLSIQPKIIPTEDGGVKNYGIPYGTYPRLLLAWISTEAVKSKSSTLILGRSLSSFMQQLDITPSGGRWGSIPRLKNQMERLFTSTISCTYDTTSQSDINESADTGFRVAYSYHLWWGKNTSPEQATLWESTVTLTKEFFEEIISRPVPIDMRALKALKGSPMRLDIYTWLTYRLSYLKGRIAIPWGALEKQFGCNFERTLDFKKIFQMHLKQVLMLYPEAKVEATSESLILKPSPPHIPFLPAE